MVGSYSTRTTPGGGYEGHSHHWATSSSFSFTKCCCCVISVMCVLAAVIGVIVLIVLVVLRPRRPEFNLQSVAVEGLSVESGGSDGSGWTVRASIGMVFRAYNPNKVGINYRPSRLYVLYNGIPLGVAWLPALYQAAHSNTTVPTRVVVSGVTFPTPLAQDLARDAAANDRVPLRLTGDVAANIRVIGVNSPKVKVTLDCQIVISPQKHALTYKQCNVDGVNF
eukprot:TRINITY_DN23569_c0_g1_i1.p1 TRINITY_DN23569_c0_g1~~TRINITY_DN23569_c0_g1_i1.p1  ORF type:complete len:223 (+),score=4.03 TRINITY_DN23569_c0_g1_i1:242-910(+)